MRRLQLFDLDGIRFLRSTDGFELRLGDPTTREVFSVWLSRAELEALIDEGGVLLFEPKGAA